jgi:outer membrane protein insertion porin family
MVTEVLRQPYIIEVLQQPYIIMMRVRSWLAFTLSLSLLWATGARILAAQDASRDAVNPERKYEGRPIASIQFVPPEQPLSAEALEKLLAVERGRPLEGAGLRTTIERLFATGRYSDIQVDAASSDGGVALRFITKNRWFIGNVSARGRISSPPNAAQIENATQLDLGTPFNPEKADQAVAGARNLLENNGLYRPMIHRVFDYDTAHQQVNVRLLVDSGPRARFTTPVLRGDPKMPPDKLVARTGWRRWLLNTWKPITQARVREGLDDIRKLYLKEDRLQAKVQLDKLQFDPETRTGQPALTIDAGPRIEVRTIGANISQKNLRRFVPVFQEHAVDQDLLTEGSRNLRDYLQSRGYFDAEVEFKQGRVTNDRASIDYLINTGQRFRLVRVEVKGNRYFRTEAIRERMVLQQAAFLASPRGRYSESLLSQDERSIANLYESNGFRDVKITHLIENPYRGAQADMAVIIQISEGPQYFVDRLVIEGMSPAEQAVLVPKLSSIEGQPFSEFNVAIDRDTILAEYFRKGFPNATFEWSFEPASRPYRFDLRYVVSQGQPESVRDVLFSGLKATRPDLVTRTIRLKPGDPLSPTAITDAQRRLYDLGIFEKVDTAIQNPDGDTPDKYVLFDLHEAARYSTAVGVGAEIARIGGCQTCLDAPAGATGFAPRVSFSVTRNNMWGVAHTLSLRTRLSTLDRLVLLNYQWPRLTGTDRFSLSFTGSYEDSRDVRTFSFTSYQGTVQLSQRISKATAVLYSYTFRQVTVDQETLKISPLLIPLLSQPVHLGLVSAALIQDHRDDPLDPHRGMYNTVDLGLAENVFGSQRNFLRFLARNSTYHPITRRVVLARNTEFGEIYAFDYNLANPSDAIPLPERFFAGGASSNRGFPDFQAGPRDLNTGFPLGGTALFFNQTELRFPLMFENVGGVLFHDLGNVYSSLGNLSFRVNQPNVQDFDYMVHAVGFGLRYRTPIGPVRLDLAYSINPPRFFGFNGSEQDLVNAGQNPCANVPSRCSVTGVSHFQFFFSIGQTF